MRKFIGVLLFTLFISPPAFAGVSCTLPFNFLPGQIADANQVMANYNALVSCLGNAAIAGINNDITALTGLTTPIAPAVGGTNLYDGGTAAGTANAITLATTTPSGFVLTTGNRVTFLASASNTGATTLTVGATSTLNLMRLTPGGLQPFAGGEIVSGQSVTAVYDGTQYQLISPMALNYPPGAVFDYASTSGCPVGSLEALGTTTVSQTTFPTLFALLGTTWGAAAGGNFTIPDLRGRATYSRDSGGSNRISVGGLNFDGTVVGNTGGAQNHGIAQVNLPNVTFTIPAGQWTPTITVTSDPLLLRSGTGFGSGGSAGWATVGAGANITASSDSNPSMHANSGGSGTAFSTLSNAAIVLKCIRG